MTGGNGRMLAAALVFILVVTGWTLAHMVPFFAAMRLAGLLRVGEEEELMGLDVSHHGGSAYRGASRHAGHSRHGGSVAGAPGLPGRDAKEAMADGKGQVCYARACCAAA